MRAIELSARGWIELPAGGLGGGFSVQLWVRPGAVAAAALVTIEQDGAAGPVLAIDADGGWRCAPEG